LLGKLDLPDRPPADPDREYLPEPVSEWVVDVQFAGDPPLDPDAIVAVFDSRWREILGGCSEYGRDTKTGRWTFLISADGPEKVDRFKMAFDYFDRLDERAPLPSEALYQKRLASITQEAALFGTATVTPSLSPGEAAARSVTLRALTRELDKNVTVRLKAPRGQRFSGRTIWDVMLCLGLEWGDLDCFHWVNPSGIGEDSFFSVETTTPPGYFLPEQIAADRVAVEDLVFTFSIPRSPRPLEVFNSLARATEYARSRLGGTLEDGEGRPFDAAPARRRIFTIIDRLKEAGFEPGQHATLLLF